MTRSLFPSVLFNLAKVPLLAFAVLLAAHFAQAYVEVLPTFLRPGHANFWEDVTAYRLKGESHKSLGELCIAYDPALVHAYAVQFSVDPGLVPSEKSALACWVDISLVKGSDPPRLDVRESLAYAAAWFPVVYLPLVILVRQLVRNFTWAICRSPRAIDLYSQHYEAPLLKRLAAGLTALPAVIALSLWNASDALTPDIRRAGGSLLDLTIIFIFLSYMSGLAMRLVQGLIAGLLIGRGRDPDSGYWDELLTIALTGPILVLVFDNSLMSLAADVAAGLGPGLVVKLFRRRRRFEDQILDVLPVEGDPASALARGVAPALVLAGLGVGFCCCGSCLLPAQTSESEPTPVTVSELERGWTPKSRQDWVELTGGHLFWPRMTQAEMGTRLTGEQSRREYYLVPLVGPELRDEWTRAFRHDGAQAQYSYARCRAVASFTKDELVHLFPEAAAGHIDPEQLSSPAKLRGTVMRFSEGYEKTRLAIAAGARDFPAEQLVIVANDNRPTSAMVFFPFLSLIGLAATLPPIIRLRTGWPKAHSHKGRSA